MPIIKTDAAPVAPTVETSAKTPVESKGPKEKYYRVRRISGFLSEMLEVEVDESLSPPVRIGKQDTMEMIMHKSHDFLWVHPDNKKKKSRAGK